MVLEKKMLLLLPVFLSFPFGCLAQSYPDLNQDIILNNGSGNFSLSELEDGFNRARDKENSQLKNKSDADVVKLPDIDFPDSSEWVKMSSKKRAFWVINEERKHRKLMPFEDIDERIDQIADDYAQYLAEHNEAGHFADGHSPTERLKTNPSVNGCMEYHWENIFWTASQSSIDFKNFSAFAVYNFIYNNSGSNWEHRQEILKKNYNDNGGKDGREGLLGVGLKETTDYRMNGTTYQKASILVLNGIDPCDHFSYHETGYSNVERSASLKIYPNPAKKHIYFEGPERSITLTLFNSKGKRVKRKENFRKKLDITDLPSGLYQLRLKSKSGVLFRDKIMIR